MRKILVTGASGKVGHHLISELISNDKFKNDKIVALYHSRPPNFDASVEILKSDISDQKSVATVMQGITHVIHLATCKEIPDKIMDVAIKGFFWILEECRKSKTFQQIILLGGDAGVGHCFYENDAPITEDYPHRAYPGCYALSKVLEEVMLTQYNEQYNMNGVCLRAPWIMEKDDFKFSLKFGKQQFGGPSWSQYLDASTINQYTEKNIVPILLDQNEEPLRRNFVHVSDLVKAINLAIDEPKVYQQLINVCMDEPLNYQIVSNTLKSQFKMETAFVKSDMYSNWLDNSKAKFLLNWKPEYDTVKLVTESFTYIREKSDEREIVYPG